VKPIEQIRSKNQKSDSIIKQLWSERAKKTIKDLDHLTMLMETFEFMGEICHRLNSESIPTLKRSFKDERDEVLKARKYKLI